MRQSALTGEVIQVKLSRIWRKIRSIYNTSPDKAREALAHSREHEESLFKSESRVFGFDHAVVGGALLDSWRLPQPLVEAVSYHHFPSAAKTDKKLTAVIHIADALAYEMEYSGSGETYVPTIDPESMKELGILQPYLTGVKEEIRDTIDETISMFL